MPLPMMTLSVPSSQGPEGSLLLLNKLGLLLTVEITTPPPHGEVSGQRVRKNPLYDLALLGDLQEGIRKCGYTLQWMLSESRGNSMIVCFNRAYLWERRLELR